MAGCSRRRRTAQRCVIGLARRSTARSEGVVSRSGFDGDRDLPRNRGRCSVPTEAEEDHASPNRSNAARLLPAYKQQRATPLPTPVGRTDGSDIHACVQLGECPDAIDAHPSDPEHLKTLEMTRCADTVNPLAQPSQVRILVPPCLQVHKDPDNPVARRRLARPRLVMSAECCREELEARRAGSRV